MGAIELLSPRGLWLLTGLVPLVVFYILKIRRTRVRIGSTWLWSTAQRDLLAKQPFRRLIAEVPLVLQILALVVLSIALARPAVRGSKIDGDHVAVILDTSASMGTATKGPLGTRMAEAKQAAEDVVSSLAAGADALLIEAARDARVLLPLSRDERQLKAAIATVAVREVEGELEGALALAADRMRALAGKKKIIVVTDGALARSLPLTAAGAELQIITVGDDADNAGIVRVDVRSGTDPASKREQVQVFVMVRNYAAKLRDAFLTVHIEGTDEPLASRRVPIPPNDKVPVVLTFEPKREDHGAGLVVRLAPGDALPIDDVVYGRVPSGVRMPVTLATDRTRGWLARALESDADTDLQRLALADLATVNIDPDAFVVVEGACPAPVKGRDLMIVGPPAGARCMGIDVGAPIEDPPITSWEQGDPRFRFLKLSDVRVARATPLKAEGAGARLLNTREATLIADASLPGRTITILGFDVGETDWPLKASFVLFMRNAVELARLHRAQGVAGTARTGEPLRIAVPEETRAVIVSGPGMPEHEVPAKGSFAIVPPIERAGLYRVRWTSPNVVSELVAANLVSEAESDVRARPVAVDSGATTTAAARVADAHDELSSWLALLAAALIALDVWWITRRTRPRAKAAA